MFDVKTAWPVRECATLQEYFQAAYGKLDTGYPYAFRGVSSRFDNVRPSFDRRSVPAEHAVKVESQLLEEFLFQTRTYLTPQEQKRCLLAEIRWGRRNTGALVVARHRMVPTRCIDWSDCPQRALFFACEPASDCDSEVWWFNRREFERCVAAQWRPLFGKGGHVEPEIEQDFITGRSSSWFTALRYMLIEDDRLDRQVGWITIAGRLGTCHAEKIHRLGVRQKGRLVIPARLKPEAIPLLEQLGITRESLGFNCGDYADEIAARITAEFEKTYPPKS